MRKIMNRSTKALSHSKRNWKNIFDREGIEVDEDTNSTEGESDQWRLSIGSHTEFHSTQSLHYALSRYLCLALNRSVSVNVQSRASA